MGLQGVKAGYRGLQRVTRFTGGYKGLQRGKKGLHGLKGVTRAYRGLQGVPRGYKRFHGVLTIMNGRSRGDSLGRPTFHGKLGVSVVDYAICDQDLFLSLIHI